MVEVTLIDVPNNPLEKIGIAARLCYQSQTEPIKLAKRCLDSGHGRCGEFADITLQIKGTAGLMREVYTHIVGTSRLQGSTRYINFEAMEVRIPPTVSANAQAGKRYVQVMDDISRAYGELTEELAIPKEDARNVLPLGYLSEVMLKINVRALMHMANERRCTRAYWEFREFMDVLCAALAEQGEQWQYIVEHCLVAKCEALGYCPEAKGCGKMYPKATILEQAKRYREQLKGDRNRIQLKVMEWQRTFGQLVNDVPTLNVPPEVLRLGIALIDEEWGQELKPAIERIIAGDVQGLEEIADGCGDTLWVVLWLINVLGLDVDLLMDEIHRSNMSKAWPDGTVHRRDDGKIIKSPEYTPVDLPPVLEQMRKDFAEGGMHDWVPTQEETIHA